MKALKTISDISNIKNLYLINNPNVNGRIVIAALIDLLNLNEHQTRAIMVNAHTKGLSLIGSFGAAQTEIIKAKFKDYFRDEGILQTLICDQSELNEMRIVKQSPNDLVQKFAVISGEKISQTKKKLVSIS